MPLQPLCNRLVESLAGKAMADWAAASPWTPALVLVKKKLDFAH